MAARKPGSGRKPIRISYTNDGMYLYRIADCVAFDESIESEWRKDVAGKMREVARMLLEYHSHKRPANETGNGEETTTNLSDVADPSPSDS